jgi:hypothetical protein
MISDTILEEIRNLIVDRSRSREDRIELLKRLANQAWIELFPEDQAQGSPSIGTEVRKARWARVVERIQTWDEKENIERVLEWPGSGGNFHWLE